MNITLRAFNEKLVYTAMQDGQCKECEENKTYCSIDQIHTIRKEDKNVLLYGDIPKELTNRMLADAKEEAYIMNFMGQSVTATQSIIKCSDDFRKQFFNTRSPAIITQK